MLNDILDIFEEAQTVTSRRSSPKLWEERYEEDGWQPMIDLEKE